MANQIPLGSAVDLERTINSKDKHTQMVIAQQMQQEANRRNSIYSLAASIVKENSKDVVDVNMLMDDGTSLRLSKCLAERSLILAHEFFKQVEAFDKNLTETQKKEREKNDGAQSGNSDGAGSVSPIITS